MRICKFTPCKQKHDSHGYCANHARQYRKYGHPLSRQEVFHHRSVVRLGNKHVLGKRWSISPEKRQALKGIRKNTGKTHFKKNIPSWNKGIPMSNTTKARVSVAKQGAKPWNKGMWGLNLREKNPNWKGGVHTQNNAIRRTRRYAQWRKDVFERDNYMCQDCGLRGVYLEADHIKPFAFYPELRFELTNGRTLCKECHMKTPTYKKHKLVEVI